MVWRKFRISISDHCQHFGNCFSLALPVRRMDHCFAPLLQCLLAKDINGYLEWGWCEITLASA
jgi:hypothetical protein